MTICWIPKSTPPELPPNHIHIWRLPLDVTPVQQAHYFTLLSEDEQQRAQRFYHAKDQMHYTTARAVLRTLLGSYCRCAPAAIQFQYNKQGKPALLDASIEFNISHAHGQALMAFAVDLVVGIDLEYEQRDVEWENLARRFFSPSEYQAILAEPSEACRKSAFFRCWTRKEAYVKAHGDGLMRNLQKFIVSVGLDAALLEDKEEPLAVLRWRMYPIDLQPAPFQAAFVVTQCDALQPHYFIRAPAT